MRIKKGRIGMGSVTKRESWIPILNEAAGNVKKRIESVLNEKDYWDVLKKKELLDYEAQKTIKTTLTEVGRPARVISEEGGYVIGEGGDFVVLDPVDGTTNLAVGIPLAVTSLAVSETPYQSGVVAGLVMNLYNGEIFHAEKGRGAWRDGRKINLGSEKKFDRAIISIDISKGAPIEPIRGIISKARHLRQLGCSAISLCYLASGMIDAQVDVRGTLRSTDVAAGLIILKEAGGIFTINGIVDGDLKLSKESTLSLVAASGPRILARMMNLLI